MLTQHDIDTVEGMISKNSNSLKNELKNDILQFKDDILTEIIHLRDDFAVLTGYRDSIENHETRIDELEKHVYPSK